MRDRVILAFAAVLAFGAPSARSTVTGTWTLRFTPSANNRYLPAALENSECTLTQQSDDITGSCGSDAVHVVGRVARGRVTLRVESDAAAILRATLAPDGRSMTGTWTVRASVGKFSATRR